MVNDAASSTARATSPAADAMPPALPFRVAAADRLVLGLAMDMSPTAIGMAPLDWHAHLANAGFRCSHMHEAARQQTKRWMDAPGSYVPEH